MINRQQIALNSLSCLYDAFLDQSKAMSWACSRGCDVCCTNRVLLTSLEMEHLAEHARQTGQEALLRKLLDQPADTGARPLTTPNQLAAMFIDGKEPPDDIEATGQTGVCQFLGSDGECAVYEARPLACRMMLSKSKCTTGGSAELDDWHVTLGLVFSQLVEQVSAAGSYGLMSDVYAASQGQDRPVLTCQNLPGIPAPPEQQARLEQVLGQVMAKPAHGGMPLGHWLNMLRQ